MTRGGVMNRAARGPGPEQGSVALLAAILSSLPRLEGALCVGARGLFFEAETGNQVRVHQCIQICRRCPCLARCREVCDGMPQSQRRSRTGVWAGKFCGLAHDETPTETGQDND